MPKIRVPKPFSDLMKEVEPREFVALLSKYGATDRKDCSILSLQW
jgi:hypothetical protein